MSAEPVHDEIYGNVNEHDENGILSFLIYLNDFFLYSNEIVFQMSTVLDADAIERFGLKRKQMKKSFIGFVNDNVFF